MKLESEPEPKLVNKRKLSEVDALYMYSLVNNLLEANTEFAAEVKKLRAEAAAIDGNVKEEPVAKVEASAPTRRRSKRVQVAIRRA